MKQFFIVALPAVFFVWLGILFCGPVGASPSTEPTSMVNPLSMKLWPGDPPNFIPGAKPERDDGTGRIWNVSVPGILVYLPAGKTMDERRTAIIVCPGGGYTHLTHLVGADGAALAFVPKDIVVISLKYRLSPPSPDAVVERDALADVQRAIQLVRVHATEWGIDRHRIGVLGWSAGANVALNSAVHFGAGDLPAVDPVAGQSTRPDFVVLLSPWPHKRDASAYPVPPNAPPAFVGSAIDDKTAPTSFAQAIADAFEKAGAKVNLSLVQTGGHGAFSINAPGEGGKWVERFLPWLKQIGKYVD
jgi:acetyl esterase/lipase